MKTCLQGLALSLVGLAMAATPAFADPFSITPSISASAMVAALVGGSSGIDIVAGSETYNGVVDGSSAASGTFTGGTGIIPFDGGVLLTTSASATEAAGPNDVGNSSTDSGSGGDADLSALVGGTTFNAAVLEFDFTTTGNTLSFQYVFGSEEYDDFVGSGFNDVFGFFLNGQNIAVLPLTTTAVAINNINCGTNPTFYQGNNAFGGGSFGSCQDAGLNTQYDGLVGVSIQLFATDLGLLKPVGETNHLKLAIADTGDEGFDSGVFLKAGSFTDQPPDGEETEPPVVPVPEPGTLVLIGTGLLAVARKAARRRQL